MIEPDFLDELGRFDASLKRMTTDVHQGEQESPKVGEGLTFSDYRRYVPGDDIRLIDWRIFARTEEYFIKQFEEERNLTVHVLVDASASMDYPEIDREGDTGDTRDTRGENKFEYAAKIGLGFCYLTAQENNDFRFSVFRESFDRLDGGRSNSGELLRLIDLLNGTEPSGESDFRGAMEDYAATIDSRSLVVVASDFLEDPDDVEAGIGALSRNEVVLAHVLAPEERDPDVLGDTIFEEPESGTTRRTYYGGRLAEQYRSRLQEHVDDVAARAETLRATHAVVDTGADFFDSFASVWVG